MPEDRTGIKVGDYINYEPPEREDYTVTTDVVGGSSGFTVNQEYHKWRVMSIKEDGTIEIVPVFGGVSRYHMIYGSLGYNNIVYVLNEVCKYLYQYDSIGITARSLTIRDIEDQMNSDGLSEKNTYIRNKISELTIDTSYADSKDTTNNTVTYKKSYSYYPDIYKYQIGAGINTTNILTKDSEYESGKKAITGSDIFYDVPTTNTKYQANSLTVQQTSYYLKAKESYFKDYLNGRSTVFDVLFGNRLSYLLATRCEECKKWFPSFGVFYVDGNGNITYNQLSVHGTESNSTDTQWIMPIVTLNPYVQVNLGNNPSISGGAHSVVVP